MAGPDATAITALGGEVIVPRFFAWLDFVGDPLRTTTWPVDVTPTGLGDPEIDNQTFFAVDPRLVEVSPVANKAGGTDTVTASLSGIPGVNDDLLDVIDDPANWRGRTARLWMGVADASYAPQGAIWPYFTGQMTKLVHRVSPQGSQITVSIESYLTLLGPATNRTYLDQARFDAADRSAEVVINAGLAAANNGMTPGLGGGSGSPGSRNLEDQQYVRLV